MEFELKPVNININKSVEVEPSIDNEYTISSPRVFRFKFNDEFVKILEVFSKIHQYDDRDTFKEAGNSWITENDEMVQNEIEHLERLGYDGDIKDKMFKSARYYFRKKNTEKKEPVKRREYINVSKELLEKMDLHIKNHLNDLNYTPKDGFNTFCDEYTGLLKEGIAKICHTGLTDASIIYKKMKKTYKNRYFMLTNK